MKHSNIVLVAMLAGLAFGGLSGCSSGESTTSKTPEMTGISSSAMGVVQPQ